MSTFASFARTTALSLILGAASFASHASLIGEGVNICNQFLGNCINGGNATVGAGVESTFHVAGGNFNVDIGADTIRFFVSSGQTTVFFGANGFGQSMDITFGGLLDDIVGVDILDVTDVSGLLASPVVFTRDSVRLAIGGSGWTYNTGSVTLGIRTQAVVPSPATLPLVATALGLLALGLRRRA